MLQLYAELGHAPDVSAIAQRAGIGEEVTRVLLADLLSLDLIVVRDNRVVGAYPFTDGETGHRVALAKSTVNAMCAVDALGIGGMTCQDTTITSRCGLCDLPIRITTREQGQALGTVQPPTTIMWQSIHYENACAANSLCTATAFFCSDDHLAAGHDGTAGFRLSLEEGLEVGRAIFEPSLSGLDGVPDPDEES